MFSPDIRERISCLEADRDPTLLRADASNADVRDMISSPRSRSRGGLDRSGLSHRGKEQAGVKGEEEEDSKGKGEAAPAIAKVPIQSMDFEVTESFAWRMHQARRFYHDIGERWTDGRKTTAWKWVLVIVIGAVVGAMGVLVHELTGALTEFKYRVALNGLSSATTASGHLAAYFLFVVVSVTYAMVAAGCCIAEIGAAGSGIPEIKAYLNGVNLNKIVRVKILPFKLVGMCFSCAAGLPLGKEGPMIHCGAVAGAAISQGKTFTLGFDTSWTKFQDLRNDTGKRDFVTFGAAAGVAAAFSAPIGGILFTLEEGASFWSTTLTFRAFFCAMITELTVNLLTSGFTLGEDQGTYNKNSMFPFGDFGEAEPYRTYELLFFILVGVMGGLLGAMFNAMNVHASVFRSKYINNKKWKRLLEVVLFSGGFATLCFVLPFVFSDCQPMPDAMESNVSTGSAGAVLVSELRQWTCPAGFHNQLASLYMVESNVAMQVMFHLPYSTFTATSLYLYFIPYFLIAAITSGILVPAGLFVPTLTSGAAFGRIVGHGLYAAFPGSVSDPGTYALLGAAAVMGGMSRLTICGAVIILEACGNSQFLLPLMLVFAAARYTGNAINQPMYDMQIELKGLPFLESHLPNMGMLNYHSVASIMAKDITVVKEINRVRDVYRMLKDTRHNGYPVVDDEGCIKGLILRKTLCTVLKLRAFSRPVLPGSQEAEMLSTLRKHSFTAPAGRVELTQTATIAQDSLERNYPKYPQIDDVSLAEGDLSAWIDVRNYMDPSPFTLMESASISKCYRLFRTMGLRHLVITNTSHRVTGMLTRHDITEHKLAHEWQLNGDDIKNYYSLQSLEPATISAEDAAAAGSDTVPTSDDDSGSSGAGLIHRTGGGDRKGTSNDASAGAGAGAHGSKGRQQQEGEEAGDGRNRTSLSFAPAPPRTPSHMDAPPSLTYM